MRDRIPLEQQLFVKHLAGECTPEERIHVESLLAANEQYRHLYHELEVLWKKTEVTEPDGRFNVGPDWILLKHRMDDETLNEPPKAKQNIFLSYRSGFSALTRIAAVFTIAILVGTYFSNVFFDSPAADPETEFREISIPRGQRSKVILSDGTLVYLNADSKLRIPDVFTGSSRIVFLEGEAFFDVTENPEKPFIVKAGGAVIRVLGTSFVVRSYGEEENVQTVVASGQVAFSPDSAAGSHALMLKTGEMGLINPATQEMSTGQVTDLGLYLSWRDGYLKFNDTPVSEVVKTLERRYDIDIILKQPQISDMRLTAELKSKSINYVLQTITLSLGLQYSFEGDSAELSLDAVR